MCGASERKEKWFLRIEKKNKQTNKHDTAIANGQIHHWSLKIKIYMIFF